MPLSPEKQLLLTRVQEAIYASGWGVVFENHEHPAFLRVFHDNESFRLLVYIWRLTPGGPPGVRPAGELRIQLTGVDPPLRLSSEFRTLLLGWHQPTGVFVGFDVTRRPNQWGRSPSVQIREGALQEASARGFGIHRRATGGQGEIAVAFSPDAFIDYARRQSEIHEFADHTEEAPILEAAAGGRSVDLDRIAGSGRRQAVRTVLERIGQQNFRLRILAAYRHHCAVCQVQLDLVSAAHIVPVPAGGDNATDNGLALCYLHHQAYDRALIGITPEYRIELSQKAEGRLRRLARIDGWANFRDNLRRNLLLPTRIPDHPNPDRLREGLQLRGWG